MKNAIARFISTKDDPAVFYRTGGLPDLGLAFLVMIDGSGKFSIDRLVHKWLTRDR